MTWNPEGCEIRQPHVIDRLELLQHLDLDEYRSIPGKLLYIAQTTRPDIACEGASKPQVPCRTATIEHFKRLNENLNLVKHSK